MKESQQERNKAKPDITDKQEKTTERKQGKEVQKNKI